MQEIRTVTVFGANGTMGKNASGIFASFGAAKVFMIGRNKAKVESAIFETAKSVRAASIEKRLVACDYSSLSDCLAQSDLVFESVPENINTKCSVLGQISSLVSPDTLIVSGTSGLSLTRMSESLPESLRKNFFGVHIYNPPYAMTLCELTPTKYSDANLLSDLKSYLEDVLLRTVVVLRDSPAFLGNRVGFQFINAAIQKADEYSDNGGIDYIDAILGPYTGRNMPPIATADYVGLDVHKAIVDNLCANTQDWAHDSFVLPEYVENIISKGDLGRKTGKGLYQTEKCPDGSRKHLVFDVAAGEYREKVSYGLPFADNMVNSFREGRYQLAFNRLIANRSQEARLCLEMLLTYMMYGLSMSLDIGGSVHDIDDVMAAGFSWCPPLALAHALSEVADLNSLVFERLDEELLDRMDAEKLLCSIEYSKYDYRPFFKARR